jgi:hypothetical protein
MWLTQSVIFSEFNLAAGAPFLVPGSPWTLYHVNPALAPPDENFDDD